jgi:hypothetical protein
VAGEPEAPVWALHARPRLGGVVQQGGDPHRVAARQLVRERLAQQRRDRRRMLAEAGRGRVALDRGDLVEHLEPPA